jgi:ribosome-associated translation inhibitor RaiA
MKYQITSDNIEISKSMQALAKEKFERLENKTRDFPDDSKHARVVLDKAPDGRFTVKAKFKVGGREYFSDETDFSLEGALIKTVEEIFQMMEKEKTQVSRRRKPKIETAIEELAAEQ